MNNFFKSIGVVIVMSLFVFSLVNLVEVYGPNNAEAALFGPETYRFEDGATVTYDIPCGGTSGTYYSKAVSLEHGEYFGVAWKATSDGTVTLKIEYEVSWVLPTIDGSSDGNWSVPDSASDVDTSLSDENQHSNALNPPAFKYLRIKITASGSNHTSTTLDIRLSKQENY